LAKHGMLVAMENCVEHVAGKTVASKVMQGSEQITEKTDKVKTAQWVKGAMERLDALVDEKSCVEIMQNCGYNCAKKNRKVIERTVARRKKFSNAQAFLEAEAKNPPEGHTYRIRGRGCVSVLYAAGVHPTHEMLLRLAESVA
jgi:hypothetical protein